MKKLTFILCVLCATMILSCTKQNSAQYTFQIPDSLIIDADTATVIPAFQKEIGDAKVVCYIVDTCSRNYKYPAQIYLNEICNTIGCRNDVFGVQLSTIEEDSFSIIFPELVGTGNISCSFAITDSTECYFRAYIEPGKINNIWVDITKPSEYSYNVYSDNIYNVLNNKLGKSEDDNSLKPQWIDLYDINVIRYSEVLDSISESSDAYSLAQLARICCEFEKNLWKEAPEDAADFIGDDFCITAYKHYREQSILAHARAEGVFQEDTPNVADEKLLSAILNKYKGKPIVVDFWGTYCGPCMLELKANEANKGVDTTYLYISCKYWGPVHEWNKIINKVKGHHYYITNESFDYILNSLENKRGAIPFKLYYSADGKLEKTQIGYKPQ